MFEAIWIYEPKNEHDHTYFYGRHPEKGKPLKIGDHALIKCIQQHLIDPETIKWIGWHGQSTKIPKRTIPILPKDNKNIENDILPK